MEAFTFNEAGVCRWCAVSEPVDLDAWRARLARADEHLYARAEALKRAREGRDVKILPALGRWLRSHFTFSE
jgi:hypothetical protein